MQASFGHITTEQCDVPLVLRQLGRAFRDQACFQIAVPVVFGEPMCDALAKGEMIEVSVEVFNRAVHHGYRIDQAVITDLFRSDQPDVHR